MIGFLRGTLVSRAVTGEVVIDVGGVGYRATTGPATVVAVGEVGTTVVLHTHLHVREDALALFGFATAAERDCFEALISAHGVGPSLALAILSVHSPDQLCQAVAAGDISALTLVPGVGPKTAARLLIELKSRLDVPVRAAAEPATGASDGTGSATADVRAALTTLGYDAEEVRTVVRDLPESGSADDLLRAALKMLATAR